MGASPSAASMTCSAPRMSAWQRTTLARALASSATGFTFSRLAPRQPSASYASSRACSRRAFCSAFLILASSSMYLFWVSGVVASPLSRWAVVFPRRPRGGCCSSCFCCDCATAGAWLPAGSGDCGCGRHPTAGALRLPVACPPAVFDFTGPALPAAAAAGCFVRWGACHGFFRGLPGLRFSHTESSTPDAVGICLCLLVLRLSGVPSPAGDPWTPGSDARACRSAEGR
mmetsp:Transcript_15306/g.39395  ORF Transcript_15306/g.39395 Transcript_15306/m.39395 type:complete len:229 (-) Transcript_15306:8-694(-)